MKKLCAMLFVLLLSASLLGCTFNGFTGNDLFRFRITTGNGHFFL